MRVRHLSQRGGEMTWRGLCRRHEALGSLPGRGRGPVSSCKDKVDWGGVVCVCVFVCKEPWAGVGENCVRLGCLGC